MARDIDWDEPLSDDDRAWAMQRDNLHAQVEANDRQFGGKATDKAQDRSARMDDLRSQIDSATNELVRLQREQDEEDNTNRALAGDPTTGNEIRDNTGVDGETPEGAPAPAETYKGWTPAKLKAEIEERNKEREEADLAPLSTSGTKAELTERLLADDREIAESQA